MKRSYIYTLLAALLLAVVAFLFFYPDAMQGNVLQQSDIQQGIANGEEGRAFTEATGETTRWTNSLCGGMPTFQISPSYASNSMLGWFMSVYTLWLPAPANILFALMLGFFIMLLCMRVRWPLALMGALAWGFSTYFIILIGAGHIWKFVTLAYIPPTIGGIALCYRRKYLAGTALAALFGALQLMSNHPQMSYYFLFVILALMIGWFFEAMKRNEVRQWCIATCFVFCAGFIAVGANAASLYNTYEYSKETIRGRATDLKSEEGGDSKGMDRDAITAWSYGTSESFSLLIPNVKGGATIKPVGGQNKILPVTEADPTLAMRLSPEEEAFAAQFPQYFGNQPMTNGPVYVGAFILLLAVLAMFVCDGPMKWCLLGVTILALLLSWGHNFAPLTNLFIDYFPGYNKFRAVSSILVIVEFTVPLLAVMCVAKIIDTPDFYDRYKWQFWCVMGVGAFICLLGWVAPSAFGEPFSINETDALREQGILTDPAYSSVFQTIRELRLGMVSADSLRSLVFILLGMGVFFLYFKGWLKNRVAFVCSLAGVVLIDLFIVNKRYVNSENFVEPFEAENTFTPTEADLAILADKRNYRVLDVYGFGNARSSYFHKSIGGYHAAKLTRYNDLATQRLNPANYAMMHILEVLSQNNSLESLVDSVPNAAGMHVLNMDLLTEVAGQGNVAALNMLNTKYFIISGNWAAENPGAWGNAWIVDRVDYVEDANAEMAGLDRISRSVAVADKGFEKVLGAAPQKAPGDTIYETSYAPNRLAYKARSAKGGVAVFSEIYFPWGWNATIDGQPAEIGRADYTLRALRLPAGEHEVVFTFDPKSARVTNGVSIACIIAIYLLCAGALLWWWLGVRKRTEKK